jgi:uncharacterized membrane-anchored protein YitT (DUF2179 family)
LRLRPATKLKQAVGSRWFKTLLDYLVITIGVIVTAFALDAFLIPARIAAGGVSGLATIIYHASGFPVGVTMLAVNIPLFVASLLILGPSFGVRTVYGSILVSVAVDVLQPLVTPITSDLALASVYGGVLSGLGLGLAFRHGGSTGGTDLAARLLNRFTHISVGRSLLLIDFVVVSLAGVMFNAELALYALISIFVASKVIDLVQEGLSYAKTAIIISSQAEAISSAILTRMGRGVTGLPGVGKYSGQQREVLLCVVSRREVTQLKNLVREFDKNAFMTITDTYEVLGEGFKQ